MASAIRDFTIMLVVIGGLCAYAVYFKYVAYRRTARRQIKALGDALRQYVNHYNRLPLIDATRDEQPAGRLISVLCGHATSGTDWALIEDLNPEKVNFVTELRQKHHQDPVCDPWGEPYHIALDRNGDSVTEIECGSDQTVAVVEPRLAVTTRSELWAKVRVHSVLAIWSNGPNRRNECGYGDDLTSW